MAATRITCTACGMGTIDTAAKVGERKCPTCGNDYDRRAEPAAHDGDVEARWHNLLRAAQEHIQTAGSEDPDDWARTLFALEAAVDAALRARSHKEG